MSPALFSVIEPPNQKLPPIVACPANPGAALIDPVEETLNVPIPPFIST